MKKYSGLFGVACLIGAVVAYLQYRGKVLSWETTYLYSQLIGEEAYYLATHSKPSPTLVILLLLGGIVFIAVALSKQKDAKKVETTPSSEIPYCPKCGVARSANVAFCHNCGYDFSLENKEEEELKNDEEV